MSFEGFFSLDDLLGGEFNMHVHICVVALLIYKNSGIFIPRLCQYNALQLTYKPRCHRFQLIHRNAFTRLVTTLGVHCNSPLTLHRTLDIFSYMQDMHKGWGFTFAKCLGSVPFFANCSSLIFERCPNLWCQCKYSCSQVVKATSSPSEDAFSSSKKDPMFLEWCM